MPTSANYYRGYALIMYFSSPLLLLPNPYFATTVPNSRDFPVNVAGGKAARNGRLDSFFDEWVYGTEVPRYAFKYELQTAEGGKVRIHTQLSQSEVGDHFAMFVPVFADFGNGMVRLGQIGIAGNSTRTVGFVLDRQPKKVALNAYKDILER
jgi:hypothetical protein